MKVTSVPHPSRWRECRAGWIEGGVVVTWALEAPGLRLALLRLQRVRTQGLLTTFAPWSV